MKKPNNLLLLGLGSILIACVTSGISVYLYHASGDIYLDRSRPGFLPEKEEVKDPAEPATSYKFSDTGPLDSAALSEYLKELKTVLKDLDDLPDAFSPSALSDESLMLALPEDSE